ncbi:MAG TPA: RNA-binding domain-containing protein [Capsulimonadaceae bacterium]|jgi:hypothetical protein
MEQSSESRVRLAALVAYPREELDVELKGWIDISKSDVGREGQAAIAQAILALSNHGGGYILIGFEEVDGQWKAAAGSGPANLEAYNQDAVNAIISRYAEPAVHCSVHHVVLNDTGHAFPVIIVPGGHTTPIRSKIDGPACKHVKMNTYYIRRPGPKSEQIQTGQEWESLIRRCTVADQSRILALFQSVMAGATSFPQSSNNSSDVRSTKWIEASLERFDRLKAELPAAEKRKRYDYGTWYFTYEIIGLEGDVSLAGLRAMLDSAPKYTGWPVWIVFHNRDELAPTANDGHIECWLGRGSDQNPSNSDFWTAYPDGKFFLLRGYEDDDNRQGRQPGTTLEPILPIWRVGECLLHAQSMANAFGLPDANIHAQVTYRGLLGRRLSNWADTLEWYSRSVKSDVDRVQSRLLQVNANHIETNIAKYVSQLLTPLYDTFGFLEMPIAKIQQELTKMKDRTA